MNADRLRAYVEAWLLRARVALDGGPTLDAKTEAACAVQALAELADNRPQDQDED